MRWKLGVCMTAAMAVAGLALAADRLTFPGDFPGPPFYSYEFNSPDDGRAAIVFLRDPDCVPADANLLALDFRALGCALTSHGYAVRSRPIPAPPDVFHAEGDEDTPVWLVSSTDMAAAVADGVLTIGELEAAASLEKGTADGFVVHEEVRSGMIQITAHGDLADGRRFEAKLSVAAGQLRNRHITVK
jgi:hypothetical protein